MRRQARRPTTGSRNSRYVRDRSATRAQNPIRRRHRRRRNFQRTADYFAFADLPSGIAALAAIDQFVQPDGQAVVVPHSCTWSLRNDDQTAASVTEYLESLNEPLWGWSIDNTLPVAERILEDSRRRLDGLVLGNIYKGQIVGGGNADHWYENVASLPAENSAEEDVVFEFLGRGGHLMIVNPLYASNSDYTLWRDRLHAFLGRIGSQTTMILPDDTELIPLRPGNWESRRSAEWSGPVSDFWHNVLGYQVALKRSHPDLFLAASDPDYWEALVTNGGCSHGEVFRDEAWGFGTDQVIPVGWYTQPLFRNPDVSTWRSVQHWLRRGFDPSTPTPDNYLRAEQDGFSYFTPYHPTLPDNFPWLDVAGERRLYPRAIQERVGGGTVNLYDPTDTMFAACWALSQLPSQFAHCRDAIHNGLTSRRAAHDQTPQPGGSTGWFSGRGFARGNFDYLPLFLSGSLLPGIAGRVPSVKHETLGDPVFFHWLKPDDPDIGTTPALANGAFSGQNTDTYYLQTGAGTGEHPGVQIVIRHYASIVNPRGGGQEPDLTFSRASGTGDVQVRVTGPVNNSGAWPIFLERAGNWVPGESKQPIQDIWNVVLAEDGYSNFIQDSTRDLIEPWLADPNNNGNLVRYVTEYFNQAGFIIEAGLEGESADYDFHTLHLSGSDRGGLLFPDFDSNNDPVALFPSPILRQNGVMIEPTAAGDRQIHGQTHWSDDENYLRFSQQYDLDDFPGFNGSIVDGDLYSLYVKYSTGPLEYDSDYRFRFELPEARVLWNLPAGIGVGASDLDLNRSLRLSVVFAIPLADWSSSQQLLASFTYENTTGDSITDVKIVSSNPDWVEALAVAGVPVAAASTEVTTAPYNTTAADDAAGQIQFELRARGLRNGREVFATAYVTVEEPESSGGPPPPPPL